MSGLVQLINFRLWCKKSTDCILFIPRVTNYKRIIVKNKPADFKWKHFQGDVILWAVRWYSQFAISYRDLVIMALERGLSLVHTTVMRWIHEFAPKLEKKVKPKLKKSNDSYRTDETYVKIKGKWLYLYRAVDSAGNTLDWMLSRYRNKKAVKRFFKKMLGNKYCKSPRVINVDKAKSFPPAFAESKKEKIIPSAF